VLQQDMTEVALVSDNWNYKTCKVPLRSSPPASKQASLFAKNNIMTILIQNVNNTMAGYQKEILPSFCLQTGCQSCRPINSVKSLTTFVCAAK